MPKCIILSGPAGAGKSTWAKHYIENNKNTIIVSSDDTRFNMFGTYKLTPQQEAKIIPNMLEQIKNAADNNINVIVDTAVVKNKSTLRWYRRIKQLFETYELVVFTTSLEKCLEQNKLRDRHVPEDTIAVMCSYRESLSEEIISIFSDIKYI